MKPIIDLSFWQRPELIDYDRLAAQIDGAILRVGYGTHKDTAFERHYAELHKRGVPLGAYHFPLDGSLTEQVEMVGAALKGKALPLKLWADVEHPPVPNKLSKATVDTIVPALEFETGVQVGIYTSHYKWREIMQDSSAHAGRWLWVANYGVSKPLLPLPWKTWKFWQHTDRGRLDGYGRNLDMNRFNGTDEQYRSWLKPAFTVFVPIVSKPNEPPVVERKPLYRMRITEWATPYVNVRSAPQQIAATLQGKRAYPGNTFDVFEESLVGSVKWLKVAEGWLMAIYTERVPEAVEGLMVLPYYSQNDYRWRYDKLGHSNTTIGNFGCLVTAVAAYMTYLGHSETPKTLNVKLTQNGGYASGNLFYWNMPLVLYGNVNKTDDRSYNQGTGFEAEVRRILKENRPVLAMVDFVPGGAFNQHWVLIIGERDGVFYLLDPWDGTLQALQAKYKKVFRIVGYTRRCSDE